MSASAFRRKRLVARIRLSSSEAYSVAEASANTGVSQDLLKYYCRTGLLGRKFALEENPTFDDSALYEIRRIERLRTEYGVSRRALPLFCDLFRQVERLQNEIRFLRGP
jgi:DNA-binding transcriptional MerR regulator